MFRLIFHDWDDESTVRILRAVLQAAGKAAVTLLIIEVPHSLEAGVCKHRRENLHQYAAPDCPCHPCPCFNVVP